MVTKNRTEFVNLPSPFGNLTTEEIAKAQEEIGTNAKIRYEETSNDLLEIFSKNDPVRILASMGWRFFAAQAMGDEDRWPAAQQHHLELLQAIALTKSPHKLPEPNRLADIVDRVVGLLDENTQAFSLCRVQAPENKPENSGIRRKTVLEQIRITTQVVRGEFQPHQLDRYLRSIFDHCDDKFIAVHGISGSALLDMLQALLQLIESRLNEHRKRCHRVVRSYRENKAIRAYFSAFPEELERRDSILADAKRKLVKPELMRHFLVEEAERFLPKLFCIGKDDIAAACPRGADAGAAERCIEAWSLAFGDLNESPIEHLYLANPVWDRPFIQLEDNHFFWPCPAGYFSFAFEMFERLMASNTSLLKAYEKSRASALEDELGRILTQYYVDGKIIRGATRTSSKDNAKYENDYVVLIDRTALLFEAKSGRVSPEARRGADRRLKREITKLMVEPARQSKRLMDFLQGERREHIFQSKDGEVVIDSRTIDRFVRVNITFNTIGPLSSRWPELADADLIDADAVQIPTMGIADFDSICELLTGQADITHYLHRRQEFEANANYYADEYDLLAFYLQTGFNIGETEFDGTHLYIYGLSDHVTTYFKRRGAGKRRLKKPAANRTKQLDEIISSLEQRQPENWLDFTDRLLNIGVEDQETIQKKHKKNHRDCAKVSK